MQSYINLDVRFDLHFWLFIGEEHEAAVGVEAEVVQVGRGLDRGVRLTSLPLPYFNSLKDN